MHKSRVHLITVTLLSLLLQGMIVLPEHDAMAQQIVTSPVPSATDGSDPAAAPAQNPTARVSAAPASPVVSQPVLDNKATMAVIAPIAMDNLPLAGKTAPLMPGAIDHSLSSGSNAAAQAPAATATSLAAPPQASPVQETPLQDYQAVSAPRPMAPAAPPPPTPVVETAIAPAVGLTDASASATPTPPPAPSAMPTVTKAAKSTAQETPTATPAMRTQTASAQATVVPAAPLADAKTAPAKSMQAKTAPALETPASDAPEIAQAAAATPAPADVTAIQIDNEPATENLPALQPVTNTAATTVPTGPTGPTGPKIVPISVPQSSATVTAVAAPKSGNKAPVAQDTAAPLMAQAAPAAAPTAAPAATPAVASATPGTPTMQPLPALQPAPPPPPKKVELPVPAVPATATTGANLILPLNKTVGIDLDRDIRDVIIGNPDIADIIVRSQKQIFLIGKKTGDTNVFLTDQQGNLIRKIDIVVQPDVDGIQSNIDAILPGEHITVKGMGDSVVLSGTASSDGVAAKAHDIARRFVAGDNNVMSMVRVTNEQQVLLRVRVAEAKKTVLKELGVDNLLSPQTLGPLTIKAATSALGLGPDIAGTLGIATSDSSSTIRLLEQQGYIRTLAEPNLLAVSGEVASMLAGGEYPIPVSQQNGTLSVEYKPFGVILSFLPVVLDAGRISLRINTEVSALSDQNTVSSAGFTFKSFITRRANSVVEMPSGGEIMIAGLLQNDITGSLNGVPGLMNLPILGGLFRSTSFQRNETELVILVSAILAKPADPHQFSLPTDGFAPATDMDLYFLGHLQDVYVKKPPQGSAAPHSLQGPLGYIVQ